jgi:hypothetical protein
MYHSAQLRVMPGIGWIGSGSMRTQRCREQRRETSRARPTQRDVRRSAAFLGLFKSVEYCTVERLRPALPLSGLS